MTTFVDFVIKSGSPRLTAVKKAKAEYGQDYSPARDFYKQLREAIIDLHENGKEKRYLDSVVQGIENQRKKGPYNLCIAGYKRWLGKKNIQWFEPSNGSWTYNGLTVRVNPELGLLISGKPHNVKLYFKSESPSKRRLETMFCLLESGLPDNPPGVTPAILGIREAKLFRSTRQVSGIETLLKSEAMAFQTIWDEI